MAVSCAAVEGVVFVPTDLLPCPGSSTRPGASGSRRPGPAAAVQTPPPPARCPGCAPPGCRAGRPRRAPGARTPILGRSPPGARAAPASHLGRKLSAGALLLVQSATILGWHRALVHRRWAAFGRRRHSGRPLLPTQCRELVLQLARDRYVTGTPRVRSLAAARHWRSPFFSGTPSVLPAPYPMRTPGESGRKVVMQRSGSPPALMAWSPDAPWRCPHR